MAEGNKVAATSTAQKIAGLPWKIIGGVIGIVIGFYIATLPVPDGLTVKAVWALGIFVGSVIWWVAQTLPDYVTALGMCGAWAALNVVPFNVAFSAYSTSTTWLLIGALGMAVGVSKSGLLNRIALSLMSKFPLTFKGQILAFLVTGTLISPLIPSASAKVAVVAPLAASVSKNMGYENKSRGAGGLFAAMFLGIGCIFPLFLSASFTNYVVNGLIPKQYGMSWMGWLIGALPWGLTVLGLGYLAIVFMYKPTEEKQLSPNLLKDQIAAIGPMSKNEKITAVIVAITLILWMTETMHGINSGLVAIGSLIALLGFNVFDRVQFRAGIPWDAIVFIGCVINIASVFGALKINAWIGKTVGPYVLPLMEQNILVFLTLLCCFLYLIRFILSSQTATYTIFILLLTPFAVNAGFNPWTIAFSVYCAVNVWIFRYQNVQYLVAYFAADGGEMITQSQGVKLCLIYMTISIVGLLVSVPFWKFMGLLP